MAALKRRNILRWRFFNVSYIQSIMLFISKIRNLVLLTNPFLKSKVLYCSCTPFQRTLVTNNILFANDLNNSLKGPDVDNYLKLSCQSEDFGKVVDLGCDFDEVKIDDEVRKTRRKRRKKLHNSNVDPKFNSNATNTDVSLKENKEDENLTGNDNVQKSNCRDCTKPTYIPLKERSNIFLSALMQLSSRKLREKNQQIIIEGKRLIHDAISAGFLPSQIFCSRIADLQKLEIPDGVKFYQVPYKKIKLWSNVVTPQGVIGVFDLSKLKTIKYPPNLIPLTIICDNIRDPGNLGSILRVAASVGCEKVILTKGCVDLWDPKVLRAGAGAHFRVKFLNNLQWTDIESEVSESSRVLLADFCNNLIENETSEDKNVPVTETCGFKNRSKACSSLPVNCYYAEKYGNESTVIIIGGETHGLSDEAYELAKKRKGIRVFIPMNNNIESLNSSVALGIISYEFKRQFDFLNKESDLEITI